jgi:hypothetical protein
VDAMLCRCSPAVISIVGICDPEADRQVSNSIRDFPDFFEKEKDEAARGSSFW